MRIVAALVCVVALLCGCGSGNVETAKDVATPVAVAEKPAVDARTPAQIAADEALAELDAQAAHRAMLARVAALNYLDGTTQRIAELRGILNEQNIPGPNTKAMTPQQIKAIATELGLVEAQHEKLIKEREERLAENERLSKKMEADLKAIRGNRK